LLFAHSPTSPFSFAQISHSQVSTLALLAAATLIWVWDFVGDVDRAGERGGGSGRGEHQQR